MRNFVKKCFLRGCFLGEINVAYRSHKCLVFMLRFYAYVDFATIVVLVPH